MVSSKQVSSRKVSSKNISSKNVSIKKKTLESLMPGWLNRTKSYKKGNKVTDNDLDKMGGYSCCMVGESYYRCSGVKLSEDDSPVCTECGSYGGKFLDKVSDIQRYEEELLLYNKKLYKEDYDYILKNRKSVISELESMQKEFLKHWNKEHVGQKSIFVDRYNSERGEYEVIEIPVKKRSN